MQGSPGANGVMLPLSKSPSNFADGLDILDDFWVFHVFEVWDVASGG